MHSGYIRHDPKSKTFISSRDAINDLIKYQLIRRSSPLLFSGLEVQWKSINNLRRELGTKGIHPGLHNTWSASSTAKVPVSSMR